MNFTCGICKDTGWVCEDHPNRPSALGDTDPCECGGAGMPCAGCADGEPRLDTIFDAADAIADGWPS